MDQRALAGAGNSDRLGGARLSGDADRDAIPGSGPAMSGSIGRTARGRNRIVAGLLSLCLCLFPAAGWAQRPLMGMFTPWARDQHGVDLGGREANLRNWEARLGRKPSSLLATDFYGGDSWADLSDFAWLPAYWKARNPSRKLMWSIPLTYKGTPLKDVADGTNDRDFAIAAQAISAATPDAFIRLGWEMNGDWTAWAAKGVEAQYIAAFRRAARIFKAASPRFAFVWCVNLGLQNSPPDLAYPGDDVVDIVGMDVYDVATKDNAAQRWRDIDLDGPYGLKWLVGFGARHGKKIAVPEWGVGLAGAPDNPYFVDRMADWIEANRREIAFQSYFDVPPHDLDSGRFALSRKAFLRRFSEKRP